MAFPGSTASSGKSRAAGVAGAAGLIAASIVFGVAMVEFLCHVFLPSFGQPVYQWDRRIMFFDGAGSIFENHGDVFTYVPHDDIRSLTVYFSDRSFDVEYDYRFHTNNYGLVQDADVVASRPSLLLLGDSFTEGQGAAPWFRQLAAANRSNSYQLVNGGLLATGFAQWRLLDRHLQAFDVNVKKLVVIFISDDFTRLPGTVSETVLRCLSSSAFCGEQSDYYRLPPARELPQWVDDVRALRTADVGPVHHFLRRALDVLPATHQVYHYVKAKLFLDESAAKQESRVAIFAFIKEHGADNVAFVHLPQKDETRGLNALGLEARRAINDAGGKLYDGFAICGLGAADYHIHDGHPNARGYDKIARCVGDVVRDMTATPDQQAHGS